MAALIFGSPQDLESRQALHHIKDVSAHSTQRRPLVSYVLLGIAAHRHHEQWDHGRGEQQQTGAQWIEPEDVGHDQCRARDTQHALRQVARDIGIQTFDPVAGQADELACSLALHRARSEMHQTGEKADPQ